MAEWWHFWSRSKCDGLGNFAQALPQVSRRNSIDFARTSPCQTHCDAKVLDTASMQWAQSPETTTVPEDKGHSEPWIVHCETQGWWAIGTFRMHSSLASGKRLAVILEQMKDHIRFCFCVDSAWGRWPKSDRALRFGKSLGARTVGDFRETTHARGPLANTFLDLADASTFFVLSHVRGWV